jgi:hypothetical protein
MRPLLLLVLAGLIASTAPASAKDHGRGNDHWKEKEDDDDRGRHQRYGEACFRDDDIRVIYEYYHPRSLPPGLQKKLYRTGQLPPGWQKKIQPFPVVVERRLPPLCAGCARGYMDGYAIVYQPSSRAIIDIHAVISR